MQHLRIIAFITLLAAVTKASLELPSTAKPKDQIDNLEKKNGSLNTSQILEPVESHLDDPNYFEGDLIVSPETIEAYYGKPNQTAVSNYSEINGNPIVSTWMMCTYNLHVNNLPD